jgi:hypothetical protein
MNPQISNEEGPAALEPGYDHEPVVSAAIVCDICGEYVFEQPDRTWKHG